MADPMHGVNASGVRVPIKTLDDGGASAFWPATLIPVTAVADTSAYANGEVLTDTMTLTNALRQAGQGARLRSITVLDEDDQTAYSFDVVFFQASQSLGTKNATPTISDANARDIIGVVRFATSDAVDVGGAKVYCKTNLDLPLVATSGRDVFASALVNTGTPTHTASGLRFKFGIEQH